MTQYKSFNTSKNKIEKIWEQNEANTSEIDNNLSTFQLDFKSINFSKKITTIPIFENKSLNTLLSEIVVVELNNFPEWLLNHINIIPIITPVGDINTDIIFSSIDEASDSGSAKLGDIIFITDTKYWIATLDNNNYLLKIHVFIDLLTIKTINPIFGARISSSLDMDLKIINPRIYERTNIHKT